MRATGKRSDREDRPITEPVDIGTPSPIVTLPPNTLHVRLPRRAVWWHSSPLPTPDDLDTTEATRLQLLSGETVAYIRRDQVDDRTGLAHKNFYVRRADGTLIDANDIEPADWPLYGIDDLDGDGAIVVTEGMRAANALRECGIPAVGTLTGANQTPSVQALLPLEGRDIVLWPDNDTVGVAHMARIAVALEQSAARVRIAKWAGGPHHGDAADLAASGADTHKLREIIEAAEDWDPALLITATAPPELRPVRSPLFLRTDRQMDFERDREV